LTGKAEAVVVALADVTRKPQLVAFCIFNGDQTAGANKPLPPNSRIDAVLELKEGLTSIAHYMMPGLILPFNSFPTLPSGKSNRKELVKIVESMSKEEVAAYTQSVNGSTEFVPVSTKEEDVMRQAWANVLSEPLENIGANSSFFSLGGDSIAAINVAGECRRLSYAISVGQILASSTLADQARCLKLQEAENEKTVVEHVIPPSVTEAIRDYGFEEHDIDDIYPCGPGQAEFLTQGDTPHQFWHLTACRELPLDFDLAQWKTATMQLTSANQILRATYFRADLADESSWYQVCHIILHLGENHEYANDRRV
jgi:aryl carrier-like protein